MLFTTGNTNFGKIYRLDYSENGFDVLDLLADAEDDGTSVNINLNFSVDYPIEALACYEIDSIQKVYLFN